MRLRGSSRMRSCTPNISCRQFLISELPKQCPKGWKERLTRLEWRAATVWQTQLRLSLDSEETRFAEAETAHSNQQSHPSQSSLSIARKYITTRWDICRTTNQKVRKFLREIGV